jgi:hypothetical protein
MEDKIKPIQVPPQLIDFIDSLERVEKWISETVGIPQELMGEIAKNKTT